MQTAQELLYCALNGDEKVVVDKRDSDKLRDIDEGKDSDDKGEKKTKVVRKRLTILGFAIYEFEITIVES